MKALYPRALARRAQDRNPRSRARSAVAAASSAASIALTEMAGGDERFYFGHHRGETYAAVAEKVEYV